MKKIIVLAMLGLGFVPQLPAEAGTASATYYSDYYVGRRMANGRVFTQGGMTAAHPSLRLGTRLKVTNPRNGRSVYVTVTDRCRCSLDLSKAAFSRLAPLRQGRVKVYIRKL